MCEDAKAFGTDKQQAVLKLLCPFFAMDDLAIRCQNQLVSLRIKELKDVLSRLGLPKQGKKQVLMEKIMGVIAPAEVLPPKVKGLKTTKNAISREDAATIVNDMYRKVQRSVAPDLASAVRSSNNIGGSSSLAHSDEQDEVVGWDEAKTRCPCGNTVDTGTMIQVISLNQFAVCSPPSLLLMYLLQSCDDKFISG
jgi:hypothetical protein